MTNVKPRISVVIITYKQEDLIKKAIESLLSQKEYIYEICVSDDCSPDNTWGVLQEYSKQYPGLFNLHRNKHNLGIFQNIEESWNLPTGDIVYRLAGDDECGLGWFKKVLEFIDRNKIDWENEMFAIFGDFKLLLPSGDSLISERNKCIKNVGRKVDILRLYRRGLITSRSCCFSTKIMKKFVKVSQGRAYYVEQAQDCQLYVFLENAYYIKGVGNIYRAEIGVSKTMTKEDKAQYDYLNTYSQQIYDKLGVFTCTKDRCFITKEKYKRLLKNNRFSIHNRINYYKYSLMSFDYNLLSCSKFLRIDYYKGRLFAILRRLPHKKTVNL